MSMPAGWYDDGSGRQRWWDGTEWTERFASVDHAPAATVAGAPVPLPAERGYLGSLGLLIAGAGTIIACIPPLFLLGAAVLVAAFIVSIIALFKKNAKKWPAIVGMIVSPLGFFAGLLILVLALSAALDNAVENNAETNRPPSWTATDQH
jgi:hypothetical protein